MPMPFTLVKKGGGILKGTIKTAHIIGMPKRNVTGKKVCMTITLHN